MMRVLIFGVSLSEIMPFMNYTFESRHESVVRVDTRTSMTRSINDSMIVIKLYKS